MQRLALSPLAFLASISLLASLSACSFLTGSSPSLAAPSSSTLTETPPSTEILSATATPTITPTETIQPGPESVRNLPPQMTAKLKPDGGYSVGVTIDGSINPLPNITLNNEGAILGSGDKTLNIPASELGFQVYQEGRLVLIYQSDQLDGWWGKSDGLLHIPEQGMQIKFTENFDNLGPAIISEVVKTEDITAQTLTEWESGIHLPGEVTSTYNDFNFNTNCLLRGVSLKNLVLTNLVDETVTLNPGLAEQIGIDRVWFTFAFRKNSTSHSLMFEARYWLGYSGGMWRIDSQNILPKFELGKLFQSYFAFVPPESNCTNSQVVEVAQSVTDPFIGQFTTGTFGDKKLSNIDLEGLLSDNSAVVFSNDQISAGDVSPYNH